ncbi:MAG TPA: metal-binding protein [Eubacteriaceae bacterium]|jgi:Zn-finger protein|nr:metal-binding protein [Eubacteriaceae bacterium]
MSKHYRYFQNKECEYYPCHHIENEDKFNCLFCYCPLYALGDKCGGCFKYTDKGIKDCRNCSIPHDQENYEKIIEKLGELIDMVKKDTDGIGSD